MSSFYRLLLSKGVSRIGIRASTMTSKVGVVEEAIREKLNRHLKPSHMEVINESYMHAVPKGSETHFKVIVVSEQFDNVPLIKRHRMINDVLSDELEHGIHALSIQAKTPSQWNANPQIHSSPPCLGGSKIQ